MKRLIVIVIIGFSLLFELAFASSSPMIFINSLSNDVRTMLKKGDVAEANALFIERFNMLEFGKLCLIDHWNEFSLEERTRFVDLLSKNLRKQIQQKVLFSKNDINFKLINKGLTRDRNGFVVSRNFLRVERGEFEFIIVLVKERGEYRVVDYEVEGALLSRNYRGHFNHLIRKYGKADFLERLERKLQSDV